jgi:hypothetical protein
VSVQICHQLLSQEEKQVEVAPGEAEEEEADGKAATEVADPIMPADDQLKATKPAIHFHPAMALSMGLILQAAQSLCFCRK